MDTIFPKQTAMPEIKPSSGMPGYNPQATVGRMNTTDELKLNTAPYNTSDVNNPDAKTYIEKIAERATVMRQRSTLEANALVYFKSVEDENRANALRNQQAVLDKQLGDMNQSINFGSMSQEDYTACVNATYANHSQGYTSLDDMIQTTAAMRVALEQLDKDDITRAFCRLISPAEQKRFLTEFGQNYPDKQLDGNEINKYSQALRKALLESEDRPNPANLSSAIHDYADKIQNDTQEARMPAMEPGFARKVEMMQSQYMNSPISTTPDASQQYT